MVPSHKLKKGIFMFSLLLTLFVILCILLAIFIFIQQGKGDMGLGGLGQGAQSLFGGSGGQDFFEKTTWVMGALFIFGALGLSMMRTNSNRSRIKTVPMTSQQQPMQMPTQQEAPFETESTSQTQDDEAKE
jgi:preprotein translocase subunit SecG